MPPSRSEPATRSVPWCRGVAVPARGSDPPEPPDGLPAPVTPSPGPGPLAGGSDPPEPLEGADGVLAWWSDPQELAGVATPLAATAKANAAIRLGRRISGSLPGRQGRGFSGRG